MVKYNLSKKGIIFNVLNLVVLLSLLITSCQNEEFDSNINKPYLSITSKDPFNNPSDMKNVIEAMKRINIVKENGSLRLKEVAKEMNVSDELFIFLEKSLNHTNLLGSKYSIKNKFPRFRTGEEGGGEGGESGIYPNPIMNDCVAYAIAAYSGRSFSEIDSIIRSKSYCYENGVFQGVPANRFIQLCDDILGVGSTNINNINTTGKGIVVFDTGGGYYHAVNCSYINTETGDFIYQDYQNTNEEGNPSTGIGFGDSIYSIYIPN